MSNYYGNLKLINGEIINLKVEKLATSPEFSADDVGRMIFALDESALKINDGSEWITIQFSNNSSQPLIDTLGKEWINNDSSLDPTEFNKFSNVTDLTSNNSLFDVLKQLDAAIAVNNSSNLLSLPDVHLTANPQQGDILILGSEGTVTNISLTDLAAARLALSISDLKNVKITAPLSPGQILRFSNAENSFVNQSTYYEYQNTAANTTFVVAHGLNKLHVIVQIINLSNDKLVTDNYSVTYNNSNRLTVTVSPAMPVKVLVWSMTQD